MFGGALIDVLTSVAVSSAISSSLSGCSSLAAAGLKDLPLAASQSRLISNRGVALATASVNDFTYAFRVYFYSSVTNCNLDIEEAVESA